MVISGDVTLAELLPPDVKVPDDGGKKITLLSLFVGAIFCRRGAASKPVFGPPDTFCTAPYSQVGPVPGHREHFLRQDIVNTSER